jgi:glycosyltransferase involved in cell wall biosynthesis
VVSGIFPPDVGGPASYVPRLAEHLAASGHTVRVLTLADRVDGHGASTYPVRRLRRGQPYPLRVARTTAAIAGAARDCDVIYANGLYGEVALASRIVPRPVVAKVVGDPAWERARGRGWYDGDIDAYQSAAKGWRLRACDRMRDGPLRRSQAVIVPSSYLAGLVRGWGVAQQRIHVVPNAVEVPDGLPGPPPRAGRPPELATLCRLVPWKGIDGLLRALLPLPEARLHVVGDGPERTTLEALTRSLALGDRVVFHGQLPRGQALAILARADAFVLNSAYEGLPHVVLEAMRLGVAVVATSAGGTPEVVDDGKTGLLVQPGDEQALTAAIRRVLSEPGLAVRLAGAARTEADSRFTTKAMLEGAVGILCRHAHA